MNNETFREYMEKVQLLGGDSDYAKGYELGLRCHFHGESVGTEEHASLTSLVQGEGTPSELGRGYADGLEGKRPAL